jgi:glycosyltransferase involved in cell wall biosynthesis
MNIVFVNYYDFRSQSGMHIFHLSNALAKLGVAVAVCSYGDRATVARYGKPKFASHDMRLLPAQLAELLKCKPGETLIHCWTPREIARIYSENLARALKAPVVVHMEDNEDAVTSEMLKRYTTEDCKPGTQKYEELWLSGKPLFGYSHPRRCREFFARCNGYTCIIESLLDFKPASVPGLTFWPSCEQEVFDLPAESSPEDKIRWGLDPQSIVLFYPGNAHLLNAEEITHLYSAVALLRRMRLPVQIIKFGHYIMDVQALVFDPLGLRDVLVDLTDRITPAEIPQVMRAADFLVQPGEENPFNHYRFPCKLPLFLASGRPVLLPPSNLGQYLTSGENCLILPGKEAEIIATSIKYLISNPQKAKAIGLAGRDFAGAHFSWDKSATKLKQFYTAILQKSSTKSISRQVR